MRQQLPEDNNPRAMLLMCYQNNEPPVKVPKGALASGSPVMAAFSAARKAGLEFWQVRRCTQTTCSRDCMLHKQPHRLQGAPLDVSVMSSLDTRATPSWEQPLKLIWQVPRSRDT